MFLHEFLDYYIDFHKADIENTVWLKRYYEDANRIYNNYVEDAIWYGCYANCIVIDASEFKNYPSIHDFIYDRSTKKIILKFKETLVGLHEGMVAGLQECIINATRDDFSYEILCEDYIDKNGFFLSSVGYNKIYIGNNLVLTPEEKIIFKDYTFVRD